MKRIVKLINGMASRLDCAKILANDVVITDKGTDDKLMHEKKQHRIDPNKMRMTLMDKEMKCNALMCDTPCSGIPSYQTVAFIM